ncbi:hypothetical protein AAFF_G00154740 [Aldrovandia affinis]|uniref:B2 bradykinin receptor n=1 Tax=Aldrovandia affinis TaxID=143900 RepID=A0AAD7WW71_9TELE|nr:hypothetical protein AAFF_G00154740 [Aldrovandia affinis]
MGSNTAEIAASVLTAANSTVYEGNYTNATFCASSEAWEWLYTMQPIYMMVICILGIAGNVFVLFVFSLHKKPCTVAEIYLSNLAVADLVLLSCLPFWAINVANEFNWQFGSLMCCLVNVGIKVNMYCSIYSLVLVSVDRCVALVHTMSYGRMRRVSYAKLSCLAIWALGLLMSIPVFKFRKVDYIADYDVTACYLEYPSLEVELTCDLLLVLLGFIIPLSIITYCTCKIIYALKNQNMNKFTAMKTEKKATLLVLSVLLAFMLCWIPFHFVTFLHVLVRINVLTGCYLESGLDISNQVFTYLALSNSVLNPILYVIVGKNFRKKVKEVFEQISQKRSSQDRLSFPMVLNTSEGTVPAIVSWATETDGNVCNHTEAWEWVHSLQPAYMTVICILGMVGNAFVLFVFCLQRECCTVADIYLGNLAVADLVMVSCLPFWVVTITQEFNWSFGQLMCQLVGVAIGMNYYCSILFLTLVSFDRYLALVRPMSFIRLRDTAWARGICLAIWVTGCLLSLPALLFRSVKFFPEFGVEACYLAYPHEGWRIRYNVTVNIVGFLVPLVVVTYCSYHIIAALNNNQMRKYSAMRTERKATYLVLTVLMVFILCWLPYQIVIFLDTLYHYHIISGCLWTNALDIGNQLATYLGYGNSTLNPFLYIIVGRHFRQKAAGIFKHVPNRNDNRETFKSVHFTSITRYNESTNV